MTTPVQAIDDAASEDRNRTDVAYPTCDGFQQRRRIIKIETVGETDGQKQPEGHCEECETWNTEDHPKW